MTTRIDETALTVTDPASNGALQDFRPRTFEQALKFCDFIAKSELVPQAFRNKPGDVFSAIQFGAEVGLGPMKALQNIAVINGRPTLWGDAMLGLVQGSGKLEWIKEEQTEAKATCTVKRVGYEAYTQTFSAEEAKRAGLWDKAGPWKQYPKRMMQMRARGYALRDRFADVLGGLEVAEVARDIVTVEPTHREPSESQSESVTVIDMEQAQAAELTDLQAKLAEKRAQGNGAPAPEKAQEPATEPADQAAEAIDDGAWLDLRALWEAEYPAEFEACKKKFKVKKTTELTAADRGPFRNTMRDLCGKGKA